MIYDLTIYDWGNEKPAGRRAEELRLAIYRGQGSIQYTKRQSHRPQIKRPGSAVKKEQVKTKA
jgi:hypothetical protein